jgi:diguanylate cyclase (GGDEF)-like protein
VSAQYPIVLSDGTPPSGVVSRFAVQVHPASSTIERPADALVNELELRAALQRVDALRAHEAALERRIEKLERALSRARESAFHDELTGLPNRRFLLNRFKRAVARAMRRRHSVAMLLLDLDRFKVINDAFGHAVGDNILRQVARRLIACLRASDTACRYGGDEFLMLLPDLESEDNAIGTIARIRAHLSPPYRVAGMALDVTASIGMAMYPIDGKEYGQLTKRADQAMYQEKSRREPQSAVSANGAFAAPHN